MFKYPVDPLRDEAPNYFSLVPRPMDFSTVREKLENNKYSTVHQWKDDVMLIFSNAASYNGKNSPIGVVAADLQSVFRELVKSLTDDQYSTWLNKLVQLRKDFGDHLGCRTAAVFGHNYSIMTTLKKTPPIVESTPEVKRLVLNSMTKRELERLAANLAFLTEPGQLHRIFMIIQKGNPEAIHADGMTIDLNLLAPQTLRDLKALAISEREMKGESY
jgi:hypothetical protein